MESEFVDILSRLNDQDPKYGSTHLDDLGFDNFDFNYIADFIEENTIGI